MPQETLNEGCVDVLYPSTARLRGVATEGGDQAEVPSYRRARISGALEGGGEPVDVVGKWTAPHAAQHPGVHETGLQHVCSSDLSSQIRSGSRRNLITKLCGGGTCRQSKNARAARAPATYRGPPHNRGSRSRPWLTNPLRPSKPLRRSAAAP